MILAFGQSRVADGDYPRPTDRVTELKQAEGKVQVSGPSDVHGTTLARRLSALAALLAVVSWLALLWLPDRVVAAAHTAAALCGQQGACTTARAALPSEIALKRLSGDLDRSGEPGDEGAQPADANLCAVRGHARARPSLQRSGRFSQVASPRIRGPPA